MKIFNQLTAIQLMAAFVAYSAEPTKFDSSIEVYGTILATDELLVARGVFPDLQAGSSLRLATFDFLLPPPANNNARLRLQARRTASEGGWERTPFGISVDVDNSEGAGGSIWFNGGNIGIGTIEPIESLHVAGGLRVDGVIGGSGPVLVGRGAFNDLRKGASLNLATFDFNLPSGNNSRLSFVAQRSQETGGWESTPIGISYDVDATTGAGGTIWFNSGRIGIGTSEPQDRLHVAGGLKVDGNISLPGEAKIEVGDGGLQINDGSGASIHFPRNADNVVVSKSGAALNLKVSGEIFTRAININSGSDLAWNFRKAGETPDIMPGLLVRVSDQGTGCIEVAAREYDSNVIGVVSGANGINTGMRMGQDGSIADGDHPVAATGRVWVWADASTGPIKPGDMLTTSAHPGHAMKALDGVRAFGSTIGKAITPLSNGRGMVLVWMALR